MSRETLPEITTETGKQMAGKTHIANEPLLTNGEARENREPGFDQFSLSKEEKEAYGIKKSEAHDWVRFPKYWEGIEFKDRVREYLREGEGREVVRHNGELVTLGDLCLVKRPKEEIERQTRQQEQETQEYLETLESGDVADIPRWRNDKGYIEDYARQQHFENQQAGLIGPTMGMDFDVVMRQFGREKVEKEMAFYRNGGRHVDATPRQEAYDRGNDYDREAQGRSNRNPSVGYNRKLAENWPADMRKKR